MKRSTTPYLDKIPIKILKNAKEIVSGPLTKISNPSLETGVFSAPLKLARETPIFKAGQKSELPYRTISIGSRFRDFWKKLPMTNFFPHEY